ncbi:Bromodomain-containing factor 1 [Golovinomyces cichoracearum]|uniref:Bromodomain-containing factor 1 n=1 Tax=Golovinomyces cichoracearum TaxID=62708 RepID=A0A420HGI7_9PEZI|nr:Bromodomain-containing factor 1 [Golovinomyces cichoracearum]
MATDHSDEVATDDNAHHDSKPETMCLDLDNNAISKEAESGIDTANEPIISRNETSESELPILNGEPRPDDIADDKMDIQQSNETVPEILSKNSLLDPETKPIDGTDPQTTIDEEISKTTEKQETTSNAVADEDIIMGSPDNENDTTHNTTKIGSQEPNSKDTESLMNSENIHGHLSGLDIDTNQSDLIQDIEPICENSMALGDFFNENPEVSAEAPVIDPAKSPGLSPKIDHSPGNRDKLAVNTSTSVKNPRENDLDAENLPSAKRLRTHDNSDSENLITKKNGSATDRESTHKDLDEENNRNGEIITAYQNKEIIKILRNISRTNSGKNFRQPVAVLWPSIADNYAAKISHPMDLSTIEKKLKEDAYSSMNDLKADVHLIYNNSVIFNSAENPLSKCAMETRNALFNKLSGIPPEPIPIVKKEKKTIKRPVPNSDLTIRPPIQKRLHKENIPSTPNTAQAYALDPATNTPLIRRDLSKADGGRPKREIHPPKNKDLPYAVRPKNKKHLLELKFCEEVLSELQKARYGTISHPFMVPVDPVALGIPNYFAIIKKPMDISTVVKKLKDGVYLNANECEKDIRQIFINCYKYNPEGNPVREMGESFEQVFNNLWAKKEQYIADNTPSAASPSDRETEEESDDDEVLDGSTVSASLMSQKERLLEEQSKLITLMGAKHRDEGMLQMQTDLVELIQKRVKAAEEQAKKATSKKKLPKPNKKPVPTKKLAPVKKIASKKKYLGTLEKETISAGLGLIPAQVMATVVEMIKTERPELEDAGDETMELDIDSISDSILWQIHAMIMKHVPELEGQIKESMSSEPRQSTRAAKPAPKRKNKPMSKHEQERKIEALTNLDSEFAKATFGSQEPPMPEISNYASSPHLDVETALEPESSGDEVSDSEEE